MAEKSVGSAKHTAGYARFSLNSFSLQRVEERPTYLHTTERIVGTQQHGASRMLPSPQFLKNTRKGNA